MSTTLSDILGELERGHEAAKSSDSFEKWYAYNTAMHNAVPTLLRVVPALMRVADEMRAICSVLKGEPIMHDMLRLLADLDKAMEQPQ